jgi:excisionase family DNA binding protein
LADPFPGSSRRTGLPLAPSAHLWIGKTTFSLRDGFLGYDFTPCQPWSAQNGLVCPAFSCYGQKNSEGWMMADTPDQAMTVRDVAGYLNVDEKTVYRLAKRGDLPGFKVGPR